MKSLLFSREYKINDKLKIVIPTVGEILEDEQQHYSMITSLISTPYDMKVALDDAGIDYEKIDDWTLFIKTFTGLSDLDTSLVFGDLDLKNFKLARNNESEQMVLFDEFNNTIIDKLIYHKIVIAIETIYSIKKNPYSAGNSFAKKKLIEFERKQILKAKNKPYDPYLEKLVISLVNTEQFKYDFKTVLDINIYAFNKSLYKIQKIKMNDQVMNGYYCGNVDMKKINREDIDWLT